MAKSTPQQVTESTKLSTPVGSSSWRPPRCAFCGRKIKNNPITRFQRHGIEFLGEGEKAHKGCAFNQYEKVKEMLMKMED